MLAQVTAIVTDTGMLTGIPLEPGLFFEAIELAIQKEDEKFWVCLPISDRINTHVLSTRLPKFVVASFDEEADAKKLFTAMSECMSANLSKFSLENYNFETGDYDPICSGRKTSTASDHEDFIRLMKFRNGEANWAKESFTIDRSKLLSEFKTGGTSCKSPPK